MTRKSSRKRHKQPATNPPLTIPQDLQNQIHALRGFVKCYELLTHAHLPFAAANDVNQCLHFLKALHANGVNEALKHPKAYMSPELMQAKEQVNATQA